MSSDVTIRVLTLDDLPAFVAHHDRHAVESGRDGDVPFMPYGVEHPFDADAMDKQLGFL